MTAIPASYAAPAWSTPRTRLRLTARGRRLLVILVALPLVVGVVAFILNSGGAVATHETGSLTYVAVEPGQSLWQVAEQIAPQSDTRDVVADIISVNALSTETLQPGQRLAVPPQYDH